MANARNKNSKYIIIGVKDKPGLIDERNNWNRKNQRPSKFRKCYSGKMLSQRLIFRYFAFEIEGKTVGVIELYDNNNPPYMLKKQLGNLKKETCGLEKDQGRAL